MKETLKMGLMKKSSFPFSVTTYALWNGAGMDFRQPIVDDSRPSRVGDYTLFIVNHHPLIQHQNILANQKPGISFNPLDPQPVVSLRESMHAVICATTFRFMLMWVLQILLAHWTSFAWLVINLYPLYNSARML